MPAPAAKVLWQAQTEQEWNKSYIQWLARWDCQGYLQGELGKIRPGVVMNPRAERWFEETDEFGFLMISIGIASLGPLECLCCITTDKAQLMPRIMKLRHLNC